MSAAAAISCANPLRRVLGVRDARGLEHVVVAAVERRQLERDEHREQADEEGERDGELDVREPARGRVCGARRIGADQRAAERHEPEPERGAGERAVGGLHRGDHIEQVGERGVGGREQRQEDRDRARPRSPSS